MERANPIESCPKKKPPFLGGVWSDKGYVVGVQETPLSPDHFFPTQAVLPEFLSRFTLDDYVVDAIVHVGEHVDGDVSIGLLVRVNNFVGSEDVIADFDSLEWIHCLQLLWGISEASRD